MGYVSSYANCPTIWASRLQIEIAISTTEAEYIALSQAIRDVLPFVSIMKEIDFVIKLQADTPTVLCSIFKNPVTVYEDNQEEIALAVSLKMRPRTKHIATRYHHFRIFFCEW